MFFSAFFLTLIETEADLTNCETPNQLKSFVQSLILVPPLLQFVT